MVTVFIACGTDILRVRELALEEAHSMARTALYCETTWLTLKLRNGHAMIQADLITEVCVFAPSADEKHTAQIAMVYP